MLTADRDGRVELKSETLLAVLAFDHKSVLVICHLMRNDFHHN